MKILLNRQRRATRLRGSLAIAMMLSLLLCNSLVVRSQQPTALKGKTANVTVSPNATIDAKEIKFKADTDNDGMPDEDEIKNGTDPNDPADADGDKDGDGLSNGDEVARGTDVNNGDSDGDGVPDGEEARLGFDPTDASNTPPSNVNIVGIQVSPISVALNINTLLGQDSAQLRVTGLLSNGATTDLTQAPGTTYGSLDEGVAFVDGLGAVIAVGAGATTINIANSGFTAQLPVSVEVFTPGAISSLSIPGTANAVAAFGNYAYVAAGAAGLQVVDMSDKQNPVLVGTLDTPGEALDVKIVDGLAYLADGIGGLRIINVTNAAAPTLLGVANLPGVTRDVAVKSGRAYVAAEASGLQIVDVSNPMAPVLVGSTSLPGIARDVDVSDSLAVVAGGENGALAGAVTLIDVSNPAAPVQLGSVSIPRAAAKVVVRDRFGYVANSNGGMAVVDLSTPARPLLVKSENFGVGLIDVAASGRYAFFATTPSLLGSAIYDLDDPSRPRFNGTLTFSPPATYAGTGVDIDGQFVYQTGYHDNPNTGERSSRLFIGQYQGGKPRL